MLNHSSETSHDTFDPNQEVFSRFGSYLSVTLRRQCVLLQSMHSGLDSDDAELFELRLIDARGEALPWQMTIHADCLRLTNTDGYVEIVLDGRDDAFIKGENVGLRLIRQTNDRLFDSAFPLDGRRWEINTFTSSIKVGLSARCGTLVVNAPWQADHSETVKIEFLPDTQGQMMGWLHLYESVWIDETKPVSDFQTLLTTASQSFLDFLSNTLAVPPHWQKSRRIAAYVNWSSVVSAHGFLKRPTMLMSKDLMNRVWSWDHCFNAMALAEQDPILAWDQFMQFFDHQDDLGAIPDWLTDTTRSNAFYKPPIHGWTLRRLMQTSYFTDPLRLSEVYLPLTRWTEWWMTYRDPNGNGIPQYHHGNDSGWDNGTAFSAGLPVLSPDLAAYLVVQMDVLAQVARTLKRPDDAELWAKRADNLMDQMLLRLWNGERFVAKHAISQEIVPGDTSLMLIPLILGDRLAEPIRQKSVAEVKRFLTDYGIPSEHPDSLYYQPDGYWRGPIWAPVTFLIVDGLLACHEVELALEISQKFCQMCDHSGMAENFDALTGAGLRDRSYTWTASVFLMLSNLVLNAELQ